MAMIEDVAYLVEAKGRSLTIKRNTTGPYDPATSSATISEANVSAEGFLLDYKERERDGQRIKAGDRKAVIQAKSLTNPPRMGDKISDGSVEGNIVSVRIIEESGTPMAYVCQLRY